MEPAQRVNERRLAADLGDQVSELAVALLRRVACQKRLQNIGQVAQERFDLGKPAGQVLLVVLVVLLVLTGSKDAPHDALVELLEPRAHPVDHQAQVESWRLLRDARANQAREPVQQQRREHLLGG